jgi:DNA-binding NarL/FixJ family response regulator
VATVLIVDDHAGFRSLARRLLVAEGFDVVGEAGSGVLAIESARRLRPEVVLLDIQLPDLDGFEVARRLEDERPGTATVLISTRDSTAYRRRLESSPALGFIPKGKLSGAALAEVIG